MHRFAPKSQITNRKLGSWEAGKLGGWEALGQSAEGRGQRAWGRGQRAEGMGQRAKDKGSRLCVIRYRVENIQTFVPWCLGGEGKKGKG